MSPILLTGSNPHGIDSIDSPFLTDDIATSEESPFDETHEKMYGSHTRQGEEEAGGNGYSSDPDADPGHKSGSQPPPHAMYGSFVGYAFTVNYILGVGVLGMPYAFYKGGYILSALCLLLVTVMAGYTALWLVDVSLRAQYLKRANYLLRGTNTLATESGASSHAAHRGMLEINHQPVSTHHQHRYEMNELTEMFLGLKARRFYELLVIIYLVGALWSYSSVFSSSLASHIGLPGINGGNECDISTDHSSSCSDLYYTYMGMFTLLVVPLTCLDLTEMKLMQIGLAIFRFVALATMMITSVVAIYSYPNPDPEAESSQTKPYVSEGMMAFNWSNLGLVFPVAVYSQIFHHSVPGLIHPLKNKKSAPRVFTGVLMTTMCLYTLLGMTVAFWYGGSTPQACTIAWAKYRGSASEDESKPGWANFIGYMVVLFPPIDIVSAFPLNAITLGNNLLCAFVEDEGKQQLRRYKLPFRILAAAPPIIGAMIVKDLSVILQYTGCVGVLIAFVYPALLQWKSRETCERLAIKVESDTRHGHDGEEDQISNNNKTDVPTYNGKIINYRPALWVVLAFSIVGLVSVIVLSIIA